MSTQIVPVGVGITVLLQVEVSDTGTQLTYVPGVLLGGKVEHQCSLEVRSKLFSSGHFLLSLFLSSQKALFWLLCLGGCQVEVE